MDEQREKDAQENKSGEKVGRKSETNKKAFYAELS
jgi:hypothetical protein